MPASVARDKSNSFVKATRRDLVCKQRTEIEEAISYKTAKGEFSISSAGILLSRETDKRIFEENKTFFEQLGYIVTQYNDEEKFPFAEYFTIEW